MVSLFLTLFIIEEEFLLRSGLLSFYEVARFFHKSYKSSPPLLLHHFEVLVVYTADSQRTTAKIEDELTVALDADDVALVALEGAGEDAEPDVVLGKLLQGFAQEGEALGVDTRDVHEEAHDGVLDGGGTTAAAVVDKMKLWEMLVEEGRQIAHRALKKDQSADGGLQDLAHAPLLLGVLVLVVVGLMDEERLRTAFGLLVVVLQPFLEGLNRKMAQVEIAPRGGLLGGAAPGLSQRAAGHDLLLRGHQRVSLDYVDSLGQLLASAVCAERIRAFFCHRLLCDQNPHAPPRSRWQKGRWGGKDTTNYWIGRFLLLFSFASGRWPFFFLACLFIGLVPHFDPIHGGDRSLVRNGRNPHFVKPLHK